MPWPLGVPKVEGYSMAEESPVIETEMEQGPVRTQRISNSYLTLVSVSCYATDAEMSSFRTFYAGEAEFGAAFFDMPLKTTSSKQNHSVRIMRNSVTVSYIKADLWYISMTVETREHIA